MEIDCQGRKKDYDKKWRERHPDAYKRWREGHLDERNAYEEQVRVGLRLDALVHYSSSPPKCAWCGIDDIDVLCIDHINNDGAQHRQEVGGGSALYRWLKTNDYPEGYQVLCWNCNHLKALGKHNKKRSYYKPAEPYTIPYIPYIPYSPYPNTTPWYPWHMTRTWAINTSMSHYDSAN